MIQYKLKLKTDFHQNLKQCDEIWVAVALMSDDGFRLIQDNINKEAKQTYLIGIGLPTAPSILAELKDMNGNGIFESRIYHKPGLFFHPKVYLVRTGDQIVAYVGSGNCTSGGLEKNIEVSLKTDDASACTDLMIWFDRMFRFGLEISQDFLNQYSLIYDRRIERLRQDKDELQLIFPDQVDGLDLNSLDFEGQFFEKQHYAAFEGTKPLETTDLANQERIRVKTKLFKLHDLLYPLIKGKKWDLHEHYVYNDSVSSAEHGQYTGDELGALWLHYGRDKRSIKLLNENATPLDFMRLQVIIHKDNLGIWNRVGKDFGSRIDRDFFKTQLRSDAAYRLSFFQLIKGLPDRYFIRLANEVKYVREFDTESQLTSFLLQDDLKFYFIIGIEFAPDDKRLSKNAIAKTIIDHFGLLYPIYKAMRYHIKI